MNELIGELLAGGPVLTDGAWGTELQAHGLAAGELPDAWNLSYPGRVEAVARAYVEAGSRVILTNTFRSNRITLSGFGLDWKAAEINRVGIEISRRAAGDRAKVFASMGPCGKLLVTGEIDAKDLAAAFLEQAQALAGGGADALVVETMTDLEEARLAAEAAQQTGLPVVVCMVFDTGKNKDRTMMGVTPERAAQELAAAGVDVIGANCGQGIAGYVPICRRLHSATGRPIWIKANAGLPELKNGRTVYSTSPDEFASFFPALVEAGASFIGGCCGTTPEFVKAMRACRDAQS